MKLICRIILLTLACCCVAGESQAEYTMAPTGVAGVFGPMSFQPLSNAGGQAANPRGNVDEFGHLRMAPTGRNPLSGQNSSRYGLGATGRNWGMGASGLGAGMGRSGTGFGMGATGTGFGMGRSGTGFGMGASGTGFGMGRSGRGFGMGPTGNGLGVTSPRHTLSSGGR